MKLRCEKGRWKINVLEPCDRSRDYDEERYWVEYRERPDPEVDTIIADANGDSLKVVAGWFRSAKLDMCKVRGVNLIPAQIQKTAELPVRQVYVHYDAVYVIELDGKIGNKLV
ncbi:MAG: hypothetical protein O2904_02220 [bacterium]|nr:hypothetical protein [bacterium]